MTVMAAGAASATLCAEYSTDEATWSSLDGTGGPCASIGTSGVEVSPFVALAAAARGDVFLRIVGKNGNGTADPQFGQISIQIK